MPERRVIYTAPDPSRGAVPASERQFDAYVVEAGEHESVICIDETPGQADRLTVPNETLTEES